MNHKKKREIKQLIIVAVLLLWFQVVKKSEFVFLATKPHEAFSVLSSLTVSCTHSNGSAVRIHRFAAILLGIY